MRLTVADTGPGMSAEVLAHLFNPFFSTKHLGAGLGLPSVYGAVKQQDGWIHVDSKPGGGATFYFYFPEMVTAYEERKPALPATDVGGRGERILLVEDDKILRLLTLRFMEANGYRAVAAATAEEALDVFRREAGRFDLIFSDIVLPGMSGIELVMELLVIKPSLRVLLTSAYNDPDTRWPILKERGMCFIDKTCSLDELKATVRMLIDAGCQTPA